MRWKNVLRFGLPSLLALVTVLGVGLGLAIQFKWLVPPELSQEPILSKDFPDLPFSGTPDFDLDLPPGPNPFPTAGSVGKYADYLKTKEPFLRRVISEYEQRTQDSGDVKPAGLAFLEALARFRASSPGAPTGREVSELGREVLQKGTQDPLLRTLCLGLCIQFEARDDYQPQLVKAVRELGNTEYSTYPQFRAHRYLRHCADPSEPGADLRRATVEMLRQHGENAELERVLWEEVEPAFESLQASERIQLVADCRDQVNSPWLLHMLMGLHYDRIAWDARGSGTADTVDSSQWNLFFEYQKKAALNYRRAWQLRPGHPEAPTKMIGIAMASQDEELSPRDWFDRAIRSEIDHMPAYAAYLWALRPRWGGSTEEMMAFGRECAASKLYDTLTPAFLLDAMSAANDELPEDSFKNKVVVNELLEALDGMSKQSADPARWLSYTIAAAAKANRLPEAKRALDELTARNLILDQAPFELMGVSYRLQPAKILAFNGPAKKLVAEFGGNFYTRWKTTEDTQAALQRLKIASEVANDPRTAPYFDSLDQVLRWMDSFYRGDWVELNFDDLEAWGVSATGWSIESPTSIVVSNRSQRNDVRFLARVLFLGPFALECDIQSLPPGGHETAGVTLGDLEAGTGMEFWVDQFRGRAGLFSYTQSHQWTDLRLAKDRAHHMRLCHWDSLTIFEVDNFTVNDTRFPIDSEGKVTFGTPRQLADRGTVRFSNLRVRRLPVAPPPDDSAGAEDRAGYFEKLVELLPHDPWFVGRLGIAYHELGRRKPAIESLERALKLGNPDQPDRTVQSFLALTYQSVGRYQEADALFHAVLETASEDWVAHYGLAWSYATAADEKFRDGKKAHEHARKCVYVTQRKQPLAMLALAAAQAEIGKSDEAIKTIEDLLQNEELLKDSSEARVWGERMLEAFKAGKPFRVDPDKVE